MATLEPRIAALEQRAGFGAGARLEQIRIVGVNPDGSEGESVVIWESPLMKNGHMDFSGFSDEEVRALARVRIEAD